MPNSAVRISFDLDDTLICHDPALPREPNRIPLLLRPWFREPIRHGTRKLMLELSRRGHEVWVFTTSYRSPRYVKWMFRFHGIRLGGVVNQDIYDRLVTRSFHRRPSKYPPAFGIRLHVDDSEGVRIEGQENGFEAVVVRPEDEKWAARVLAAVDRLADLPNER